MLPELIGTGIFLQKEMLTYIIIGISSQKAVLQKGQAVGWCEDVQLNTEC